MRQNPIKNKSKIFHRNNENNWWIQFKTIFEDKSIQCMYTIMRKKFRNLITLSFFHSKIIILNL